MSGQKITNKHYREFLDKGIIQILNETDIKKALKNVKGKYTRQGRSLIIILYYSGARPNEILNLRSKDIQKDGKNIAVYIQGSKGGLPRTLQFQHQKPLIKEFYDYATSLMDNAYLFYHYRSKRKRIYKRQRKGIIELDFLSDKLLRKTKRTNNK